MHDQNKNMNVTVCALNAGLYLNAPFALMVNDDRTIAGLDKGFLILKFQAPASKTDRQPLAYMTVNDRREHVVNAARAIKNPLRPTEEEMKNLAAAMRKQAHIQVKRNPRGYEFVNVSYPNGAGSKGYFAVNYYKPNAPVYNTPDKGEKLWSWESKGANGTVQMMFAQTRFDVVMDGTKPEPKPEAKPETPTPEVPATPTTPLSDEHDNQTA